MEPSEKIQGYMQQNTQTLEGTPVGRRRSLLRDCKMLFIASSRKSKGCKLDNLADKLVDQFAIIAGDDENSSNLLDSHSG
jgi:hypothetical protein